MPCLSIEVSEDNLPALTLTEGICDCSHKIVTVTAMPSTGTAPDMQDCLRVAFRSKQRR
jgi:hypothetical protein